MKGRDVLYAIFCAMLWGSAAPFIKWGYELFGIDTLSSVFVFAGVRFAVSGIAVLLWLSRKMNVMPQKSDWPAIWELALVQTAGQYIFYYWGIQVSSGAMGAVMTGIGAFISLILSVLFGMEKMRANKAGGMVLGLMGIAWMNAAGAGFGLGEWLLLVSQVFGALAAVLASLVSRRHDILLVSAWQFVFGGLLLALPGFAMGGRLWSNDVLAWLNLAYLSFVSATAYTLYNWLLSKHPVSSVAVWTCLIPIAGVFWSWILLGEDAFLSWTTFPSVLLVVAGVWLVNKKTAR